VASNSFLGRMVYKTKILVTGAGGFVGSSMCARLQRDGIPFTGAVRKKSTDTQIGIGNITPETDWSQALAGCDVVIHLAARVHVMNDTSLDPLSAFRAMNVDASVRLARQAINCGVKRFVFVSSIKVNGEETGKLPFSASDVPAPLDSYGRSKLEAELALAKVAEETGLEVVVVRPPLVYGPGVGANFLRLMQLVKRGIPLPLGAVHNRRSMVALDNLVDLLLKCARHPAAPGRTFLVSDGEDASTPDLIRMLAAAMGKRSQLWSVPPGLLVVGAAMLGKSSVVDRLLGSLQVDIEATRSTLNWRPVVSMSEAIDATAAHFLSCP
jgi:UDP-glucose 4-epimerase